MSWSYTPDRAGVARYLNENRELKAELHRRALLGKSAAVAALEPRRHTGRLAASADVTDDGPNQGVHHDRMGYSVRFTVDYAVPATFPGAPERAYLDVALRTMEAGG